MFWLLTFRPKEKTLRYNKECICDNCGQYGRYEVFMTYTCLEVFFIPILKGDQKYFVRTTCCGSMYQLNSAVGKAIAKRKDVEIRPEHLKLMQNNLE